MTAHRSPWIRTAALLTSVTLAAVVIPAFAADSASAATQSITITASGFVPMNLAIKTGDTISFTNSDVAAHQVLFKQATGFTCTVTHLVVQPTKTQSCTWTVAGSYPYSDPNQKGGSFRGTVTVDPVVVASVTLAVSNGVVKYGNDTTLSGKITPNAAGTTVDILAMASGETAYVRVASVSTTNNGAFTVAVTPEIQTSYRAEFQDGAVRVVSSLTSVQVRPQVRVVLRYVGSGRAYVRTSVISGTSYAGKYVLVQRMNNLGRWTTVKRVTLGTFSSARFAVRVPIGNSRIRTFLTASQAGVGYLSSASRTVLVTR